MAPVAAIAEARRCVEAAKSDPDGAARLLDRAVRHIRAALKGVTPVTPEGIARAVTTEAELLFATMQCFEEGT